MEPATAKSLDTRIQACTLAQPDRHPDKPDSPDPDLPVTATAPGYTGTFDGRVEEAARVRREIAGYVRACPAAEDLVLIASELAANASVRTPSPEADPSASAASYPPARPGSRSRTRAARGGSGATPTTGPTGWTSSRH